MKKILNLLVAFIIVIATIPCFATTNKTQTNRVVVTFSPLVVNNLNCTSELFEVFSNTVKKDSNLSEKLEASGALWSISQNLSGIQISISSPQSLEELYQLTESFLTTALKNSENIVKSTKTNIKPADRLYQFFTDSDSISSTFKPVSIRFFNSSGSEQNDYYVNHLVIEEITPNSNITNDETQESEASLQPIKKLRHDFIEDYCNIYKNTQNTNKQAPKIQNVAKPILANFLCWNSLTPETFISASLIKNRFIYDDVSNQKFSIELFNTTNGLVLAVYCDIDKNEDIYNKYLEMCKSIDSAISSISSKEWSTWASKLLDVMKNDKRDYSKKAMFDAWCKHWNGTGFENIPTKLDFKKPDYTKEVQIFSSISDHNFNLSADTFPAIYACNDESFKEDSIIAVCIKGHDQILSSIENHISNTLQINVPITINQKPSDSLVISFYCPEEKVPAYLSRIKASIANHLYSKFNITDLKKSIRIGIAGISSIPAYRLKGLLTLGWPTKSARYESRVASNSDLYSFVKSSNSSDDKNFKLRWENMASSPQDKAKILAMLACHNLTINSWERE